MLRWWHRHCAVGSAADGWLRGGAPSAACAVSSSAAAWNASVCRQQSPHQKHSSPSGTTSRAFPQATLQVVVRSGSNSEAGRTHDGARHLKDVRAAALRKDGADRQVQGRSPADGLRAVVEHQIRCRRPHAARELRAGAEPPPSALRVERSRCEVQSKALAQCQRRGATPRSDLPVSAAACSQLRRPKPKGAGIGDTPRWPQRVE